MTMHPDTPISAHESVHGMIDPMILGASLAVFSIVSYFLCIGLSLLFPPMATSMKLLYPAIFPGFVWLTAQSIAWGAIFLSLVALYVGCGFALVYNAVCRIAHSRA